ncbi:MAG: N-acetyltransferase [Acidobacteria bacterium]|nr:N-acetyltransferase [Acidobacteriota bacterium]
MRNHPGEAVELEMAAAGGAENCIIRPAQLSDVGAMLHLINDYAARQIMLPRTELELCEGLRDFLVATEGDELVGCGALHFYTQHMSELRSLAVAPDRAGSGLGQRIAAELLEQARQLGVDVVFVFTYVPGFFEKLGFRLVNRAALPLKAWKDCLRCPKFQACDEVALAYAVTPGAEIYLSTPAPAEPPVEGPFVLPVLGQPRILDKG